ncbi:MAG: DNA primase [Clostridia bacterium]|nr:DNA primase [Oscillospiraceae bacterium]MBQ6796381.1 DNA primase [Clostridia bacterium]
MAIPQEFLSELRDRCDITSLISGYVNLKRAGTNYKGLCPFHSEKTPSFTVFPDTKSFYCFGCQAGGDAVTFVRLAERLDYVEAVKFLASREGMTMPEDGAVDGLARAKMRVREQNRIAAKFYYHQLYSPAGREALEYLHSRGLTDATIGRFGLGWSPNGYDQLSKLLLSKGYREDEIIAANLGVKRNGRLYDFFWERVMFPIIDLQGSVVGFGGRTMKKDHGGRKYVNTDGNSLVYKKSENLYGLNFAKDSKEGSLVVVEGFMDVITLSQAGFDNVVASQGTAFNDSMARLAMRYSKDKRIILSQDGDAAGQNAIRKSIPILKRAGADVRVLSIPESLDPDEYIRKYGAGKFRSLLDSCASDIEFEIAKVRERFDLSTDDGKLKYLNAICPLLGELSRLEREVYAGRVGKELDIDKAAIISQIESGDRKRRNEERRAQLKAMEAQTSGREDKLNPQRKEHIRAASAEDSLLTALFYSPDKASYIKKKLPPEKMVTDFNRRLYTIALEIIESGQELSVGTVSAKLTTNESGAAARLFNASAGGMTGLDNIDFYIDIILGEAERLSADEIATSSPEDLMAMINAQRKKKD